MRGWASRKAQNRGPGCSIVNMVGAITRRWPSGLPSSSCTECSRSSNSATRPAARAWSRSPASVTLTLRVVRSKPIVKGLEAPLVLVAHPSVPARNLAELAEWIRNPANKVSYASFSAGTPSHFLGCQLNERLKANMVHVPYKGSVPQV